MKHFIFKNIGSIILVIVLFRNCYDFPGQIEVAMDVIILKDRHRVFASLSCRFHNVLDGQFDWTMTYEEVTASS